MQASRTDEWCETSLPKVPPEFRTGTCVLPSSRILVRSAILTCCQGGYCARLLIIKISNHSQRLPGYWAGRQWISTAAPPKRVFIRGDSGFLPRSGHVPHGMAGHGNGGENPARFEAEKCRMLGFQVCYSITMRRPAWCPAFLPHRQPRGFSARPAVRATGEERL